MADIFNQDFLEYIECLNKHNVQYLLVGGLAVNLHGYRRATGDMDIFVNPTRENHEKLKKTHVDFGLHMGEMAFLENFLNTNKYDVYTFGVSPCQIDVMTHCKGIVFEEVHERAREIVVENVPIKVIHYNDLKIAKSTTNRLRDKADIEELEKIRKIKK